MAILQQKLESGEIARGSILIVEAFDRITRQELGVAIGLLGSLITNGLIIVTLTDGRVWDQKSMNEPRRPKPANWVPSNATAPLCDEDDDGHERAAA